MGARPKSAAIRNIYNREVDEATLKPYPRADPPRPDVNEVTGYPGDRRFSIHASGRTGWCEHTISLIAVVWGIRLITSCGALHSAFQVAPGLPMGFIDTVEDRKTARGWAFDPDNSTAAVTIKLYLDAQAGTAAHVWERQRAINLGQTSLPPLV